MVVLAAYLLYCVVFFGVQAQFTPTLVVEAIDNDASWPPPTVLAEFAQRIQGDVYFPGTDGYLNGTIMMNSRWNSQFGVVVMVENTDDVQKSLLFCKKYRIRPTVKCTGHDYIGRSGGKYTFSINLGRLRYLGNVIKDDRSETGYSMVVQPGVPFAKLYKHVHDQGKLIQGGSAHTVSPGGYTQGGGHGPMSRMLGLGADNAIAFTLVTPDGSIITMTKDGGKIRRAGSSTEMDYNDPDLFWSVRGGGGGTYGVVTSYTFQVHDPPPGGFCHIAVTYPIFHSTYGNVGDRVLRAWSDYMSTKLTDKWGGLILLRGQSFRNVSDPSSPTIQGTIYFSLLHFGSCLEGKEGVDAILNIYPQYQFFPTRTSYATFWDYEKSVTDDVGYRNYIINRLIQPEDLLPGSRLPNILSQVAKIPDVAEQVGCTWILLGGKVSRTAAESAAVSPDFRSSIGSISCGIGWIYEVNDASNINALQSYSTELYKLGKGVYYNEPDYYLQSWQTEYWGSDSRYQRLLKTKRKYDPDNMFWCHHCVGDEGGPEKLVSQGAHLLTSIYLYVANCVIAKVLVSLHN